MEEIKYIYKNKICKKIELQEELANEYCLWFYIKKEDEVKMMQALASKDIDFYNWDLNNFFNK